MFQVRHIDGDEWVVTDTDDAPVYKGTYRQCEQWLDGRENAVRPEEPHPGLTSRLACLLGRVRSLFSRREAPPRRPPA